MAKKQTPRYEEEPFNVSIGEAIGVEKADTPPTACPPQPPAQATAATAAAKVTISRSRKGRKGHTVTVVNISPPCANPDELARKLRKAMGCGSGAQDGSIVLQGDLMDRLPAWFEKEPSFKGIKIVISGK